MTGAVHLRRLSGRGRRLKEVRVTCNEQDNLKAEVTALWSYCLFDCIAHFAGAQKRYFILKYIKRRNVSFKKM